MELNNVISIRAKTPLLNVSVKVKLFDQHDCCLQSKI